MRELSYPLYLRFAELKPTANNNKGTKPTLQTVLVATNRGLSKDEDGSWYFGGELNGLNGRQKGNGPISWALAVVEVDGSEPEYGRGNAVKLHSHRIASLIPVPVAEAEKVVASAAAEEVLCYVHGFATPFANAVRSAAIYARAFHQVRSRQKSLG